jgi:hypothetical protein
MAKLRTMVSTVLALGCLAALASSCATEPVEAPQKPGFGRLELALTGSLTGAKRMSIRLFRGALTAPGKVPAHAWACQPYGGSTSNKSVVQDLEAADDYSVLVELYEDDACSKLRYRAYRGGIAVKAGTGKEVSTTPYWLPTVEAGHFSAMAQVNAELIKAAASKTCASDEECRGVHVNAVCAENHKCTVENLFPLNGAQRRAFATMVTLSDGRVGILGGFGVLAEGYWAATAETVEVYEPSLGIFSRTKVSGGLALGLADAVTLTGGSFAYLGGATGAKVLLANKKLTTQLDTRGCTGAPEGCAVDHELFRWTLDANPKADSIALGVPVAFPQIAAVTTAKGNRLLVAGGADVPILGDKRRGQAQLCVVEASGLSCPEQPATAMKAQRAQAAVSCLGHDVSGNCIKVGLFGGRVSGPLSELFDGTSGTFAALQDLGPAPASIHGGKIYPFGANTYLLIGGTSHKTFLEDSEISSGGDLPVYKLTVDTAALTVTWAAVDLSASGAADGGKRLWPASVQLADGSVLVMGGLDANLNPLGDAIWIAQSGSARVLTNFARFGASAAVIGGKGPMGGCVVLGGGFGLATDGSLVPQNQIELFCL